VHRDLSAANVLLTTHSGDDRGFRALLSDFGEPQPCCALLGLKLVGD
jgi:hypothetical protein